MKIDEMQAGREMDALVAEKVMELPKDLISTHGPLFYTRKNGTQVKIKEIQYYSTEIAAAWEVVEKMRSTPCSDGDHFCFDLYAENNYVAVFRHHLGEITPEPYFEKYEFYMATADTVPLAICQAALKAVLGRDDIEL